MISWRTAVCVLGAPSAIWICVCVVMIRRYTGGVNCGAELKSPGKWAPVLGLGGEAVGLLAQQNTQSDLSRYKPLSNKSILKHFTEDLVWYSVCFFFNTYLCIIQWTRHTSICLFLVLFWFDFGFLALSSTSLSGCTSIPLMRLHTVYLTLCFLPAHWEQGPWRELERINP